MKLQILAVDPTSGSTSHVTFESPNAMWDAFSTLSDEQKTYHELIGANDCQKVHFRIKILPGQEDRTEALVTAVKSAFQKIWSKKLRDDQVILTQTELPSGRVVDLVVDGYSVESSRMSISLANVIQKKAERFTLDQSVYHKNARWVCLGNYTPFADGTSVVYKTAVKPLVGEQRVFQVQTLVTYTANTEALADKFKEMVNSQGQHSEVVLGQPQSVGPEDQAVGQNDELPDSETPEQPEEECPNEEEQTNQGDLVEVDQTDGKKKPGLLKKILFGKKDKSEKKDKKEKNDKKNKKDKKEKDKKKSDKIYKSKTGVVKTVLFGKAKKRNQDTYEKEKIDEITVN